MQCCHMSEMYDNYEPVEIPLCLALLPVGQHNAMFTMFTVNHHNAMLPYSEMYDKTLNLWYALCFALLPVGQLNAMLVVYHFLMG